MTIPGTISHLPRLDGDAGRETQGRLEKHPSSNVPDSGNAASELRRAGPTGAKGVKVDVPENIEQAAEEFEALLVAQMLKTFRESGSGGWLGSDDGKGANPAMDLAETQLAKALAQGGALGIKQQLMKNLAKAPTRESASGNGSGAVEGNQARTGVDSVSEGTWPESARDDGTAP